jgi:putative transposase
VRILHAEREEYFGGENMPQRFELQVFDPKQEIGITQRKLPHWSQAGTICFITWRTWDSIPSDVLEGWLASRAQFLLDCGIDPDAPDWTARLSRLPLELQREFRRQLSDRWHENLDACHGKCVLRDPTIGRIVAKSLSHFDGDRYEMTDFVIMPNHVHFLVAFPTDEALLKQCESWKHYTAVQINRSLGRSGRFWQQDGFDHLVRSAEQFLALRNYIAENPVKARLKEGEFTHFRKDLVQHIHR